MLKKLPSIAWVLIFIAGLLGIIFGIPLLFYVLANVEGVVSIIFILIGLAYVRGSAKMARYINDARKYQGQKPMSGSNFATAAAIVFFALMGMAIDQPGNYFYNLPIGYFCPEGTSMNRDINVSHPLPERTDITQDYSCYDNSGEFVQRIGMEKVIVVRFVEYIILGYAFYYLGKFFSWLAQRKQKISDPGIITT